LAGKKWSGAVFLNLEQFGALPNTPLLLFNTCSLETPYLQSNEQRSFFYSKQTSGTTYKATSTTKNNAPIKRKSLKERTKG
jgi:hypothetical protein